MGVGWGAEACSFLGDPHKGLGLEEKKDRKGSPLGNIRISGLGPGLHILSHSHGYLPPCSEVSWALVFKHMPAQVRTQAISYGTPCGKGRAREWERGAASGSHQGQDEDGIAATI